MNVILDNSKIRAIPEIDGLRAVAIILVILFHLYTYMVYKSGFGHFFNKNLALLTVAKNGHQGVELFFVISGFIIAVPFIRGKRLKIIEFYKRRLVRILPAFYVTLLLFFVLYLFQHQKPLGKLVEQLFASLTFTSNLLLAKGENINPVGWSLEIEIQFYMLLPLLYKLLIAKNRNLVYCTLILIIAFGPLLDTYLGNINSHPTLFNYLHFFALGILLAELHALEHQLSFGKIGDLLIGIGSLFLVMVMTFDTLSNKYLFVGLLFTLIYFTLHGAWLKKILGSHILAKIGLLSFSLYLIHYQVIAISSKFLFSRVFTANDEIDFYGSIIAILLIVALLGYIFYTFVERKISVKINK